MYVNTLESSHLQELWKHVESINENKTPVTKARDFFRSFAFWEGKWSISKNNMIEVYSGR